MTRYWRRRLLRHSALAALTLALGISIVVFIPSDDRVWRVSMATAYVALALLATSLAIGPLNVLRRRPNPVSADLRRDVGIWAAIVGVTHVGVGLFVHFRGRPWLYFVYPADQPHVMPLRYDLFGFANHTGLLAGLGLLLLLVISNDRALVRLGTSRWKRLQQMSYPVAVLTAVHAVAYQVIEDRWRQPVLIATVALVVLGALTLQLLGVRQVRATGKQAISPSATEPKP